MDGTTVAAAFVAVFVAAALRGAAVLLTTSLGVLGLFEPALTAVFLLTIVVLAAAMVLAPE
ncbi:hypothetical protein AO062_16650 [Variovorax boronicumulans]|nr:hypothetical protein AO062_16650 [Variovorax boronicumulans]